MSSNNFSEQLKADLRKYDNKGKNDQDIPWSYRLMSLFAGILPAPLHLAAEYTETSVSTTSFSLLTNVDTDITVDWGDGETEIVSIPVGIQTAVPHSYDVSGDYTIQCSLVNDSIMIGYTSSAIITTLTLYDNPALNALSVPVLNITDIIIGNNVITDWSSKFAGKPLLVNLDVDISAATIIDNICLNCTSLVNGTVPLGIQMQALAAAGQITSAVSAFNGCTSLTNAPFVDLSGATAFNAFLRDCDSIISAPLYTFPASGITGSGGFFYNCLLLETVEPMDVSGITDFAIWFDLCPALLVGRLNGGRYAINYADCVLLDAAAINDIFDGLGTADGAQVISIPAGKGQTDSIATNKGWTVTVV
jgi:hypothetical protein